MLGPQTLGNTEKYRIYLDGPRRQSLAGNFTGSEQFSARIWAGDDQAGVSVTAAWDATIAGNPATVESPAILLTVDAAAVASLAPGRYQYLVTINPATDKIEAARGWIEFTAGPGTGTPAPIYGVTADLATHCPWVAQLQTGEDQAGYREQLAWARQRLNETLVDRARHVLLKQAERHGPVQDVAQPAITSGVDAGPSWGQSIYPDATLQAQVEAIRDHLEAGRLMLDDGVAVEVCCLWAAAKVARAQIGDAAAMSAYQAWAASADRLAARRLRGWCARIDTDSDGDPDLVLEP